MWKSADAWAEEAVEAARVEVEDMDQGDANASQGAGEDEPLRVHLSDFEIEQSPHASTRILFKVPEEESLDEFIEATLDWMEKETRPMCISVDVFMRWFMEETNEALMACVKTLTEAAISGGLHRITFSTMRFVPDYERHWYTIGELNNEIRTYTQSIGEQALSLHKAFMSPQEGVLACFAACYAEFFNKSSLGKTPSELAVQQVLGWLVMHHKHAYIHKRRPKQRNLIPLPMPLPLSMTKEWAEDEYMVRLLKSRGLFRGRRARSSSRKSNTRRTSHRTLSRNRADSVVSGAMPRGGRSPMSNGCLERLLHQVMKSGRTRDNYQREREVSRVTGRISSLYKDKCAEVTGLRVEVETMKLQLDLLREKQEGESALEVNKLKLEVKRLRENERWQDASYDRLFKVKDALYHDKLSLEEELENLKLSKKERRQKKKDKKRK